VNDLDVLREELEATLDYLSEHPYDFIPDDIRIPELADRMAEELLRRLQDREYGLIHLGLATTWITAGVAGLLSSVFDDPKAFKRAIRSLRMLDEEMIDRISSVVEEVSIGKHTEVIGKVMDRLRDVLLGPKDGSGGGGGPGGSWEDGPDDDSGGSPEVSLKEDLDRA